ncbi:MAG: type II secretion system F family protein [Phycisphaeraceae bacterium]
MGRYAYEARNGSGAASSGVVAAGTAEEASRTLRDQGLFIIRIAEADQVAAERMGAAGSASKRVKRQDVINFAQQLSVMIQTGVSISEALTVIGDQAPNPAFGVVLGDVAEQVESGIELSGAMKKYPKVFPTIMVSLIRAAEASGTLGQMLERISDYMSKELRTAKQVKGAMIYPAFMIFLSLSVTVFLLVFVLPNFAGIYQAKGQALPAPTQFLMSTSTLLVQHWPWFLGGAITLIAGSVFFARSKTGGRTFDWLKLNAPLFKHLFTQLYVTRSCRTLGAMVNAGVPMLDAIDITRHVTANCYYEELWNNVDDGLQHGRQLSDAISESDLIPRSVVQMIRAGEKSGRLGQVLNRVAEFSEDEFDRAVKQMTQFIEPAMIVIMGSLIGFVAISLLLPIFSVGKVAASN